MKFVESRTSVPTVEKNLKDINDTTGETTGWQDSADYDINDSVPFQLTATLPDNLASYDEYYLELSDTLSTGLTYNKDAKVYLVNGTEKLILLLHSQLLLIVRVSKLII